VQFFFCDAEKKKIAVKILGAQKRKQPKNQDPRASPTPRIKSVRSD
jgi:hypothetical protein